MLLLAERDLLVGDAEVKHGLVACVRICLVPSDADLHVADEEHEFEVPHLDRGVGGRNEPIVLGTERHRVDGAACIQGVQMLAIVHIPEHGCAIFAARQSPI